MPWLRRLVNTICSSRLQRDIDREIGFHIREREDELRAHGLPADEAHAGVYGTVSYAVSLRRREVALRLALGALRWSVVQHLIATSLRIVCLGAGCGLILALLFTRNLSTMLYGVTPSDPLTLTGVFVLVMAVAGLAAIIPATRAAFMSPIRALREE